MLDLTATLLPWLVAALLAVGLTRQFAVSGRTGLRLDRLAIVPQWKFYGQSRIASDPSTFDDLHLLARRSANPAGPGEWQALLWAAERRWIDALWNPRGRSRAAIAESALLLALGEDTPGQHARPTALSYLTVLRHCLDRLPPGEGEAIQFAIVQTRGRSANGPRPTKLRLLSAWHSA
jgi:hypothetical protein